MLGSDQEEICIYILLLGIRNYHSSSKASSSKYHGHILTGHVAV